MGIGTRLYVWSPTSLAWEAMNQTTSVSGTVTTMEAAYATRIVTVGSYTYIGKSAPGTAESASLWQIARIDDTGNKTFADGVTTFTKQWSIYNTYTYS